jgi:hypothetical protein
VTVHCDDCRDYESQMEQLEERQGELARLLREGAEAEGWDTEQWAHWQSDARAALQGEAMGIREDDDAEAAIRREAMMEALEWALRRMDGVSARCMERIQMGLFRLKRGEGSRRAPSAALSGTAIEMIPREAGDAAGMLC